MSAPEQFGEQRSSVKISTTAKGDAQVEVKVYDGAELTELDRIRAIAVSTYNATRTAVQ